MTSEYELPAASVTCTVIVGLVATSFSGAALLTVISPVVLLIANAPTWIAGDRVGVVREDFAGVPFDHVAHCHGGCPVIPCAVTTHM